MLYKRAFRKEKEVVTFLIKMLILNLAIFGLNSGTPHLPSPTSSGRIEAKEYVPIVLLNTKGNIM